MRDTLPSSGIFFFFGFRWASIPTVLRGSAQRLSWTKDMVDERGKQPGTYVALMGAYERDNFGDILFLKVLQKLLSPWPQIPLSFHSSEIFDMDSGPIISASAWFDVCQPDFLPAAFIVAGGEVLTCSIVDALSCNAPISIGNNLDRAGLAVKTRLAKSVAWRSGSCAYVPDMRNFLPTEAGAIPLAINSAGGVSLEDLPSDFREVASDLVKQATFVSVRDSATHQALTRSGGAVPQLVLSPDIVSVLPSLYAEETEKAYKVLVEGTPWLSGRYLAVQASTQFLRAQGLESLARAIAKAAEEMEVSVVFQPAGVAQGHDSIELLMALNARVFAAGGGRVNTLIQADRDIWSQVALISHAACFIGTSLHGRVVASAFGRPRVGLSNKKVACYAATWEGDTSQPYDVSVEELGGAIQMAMGASDGGLQAHARKQHRTARDAFKQLTQSLGIGPPPEDFDYVTRLISAYRHKALLRECTVLRGELLKMGALLEKETRRSARLEEKVSQMVTAPSWKLSRPLRALDRIIRGKD